MYTEHVGQPLKKKKKNYKEEINRKTNDYMSDLSPNISSVNVT